MVVALACAGCSMPDGGAALRLAAPPAVAAPAWWVATGDPLLADLVAEGLAHAPPPAIPAPARIVWPHRAPDAATLRARAEALADARAQLAQAIGQAYLEARRTQAHVTLRGDAVAGLRDNAEIAGFRREAGLVSAVDTGLAGVLVGLNEGAMLAARADRDAAVARLADLIGDAPGPLTARIEGTAALRVYDPLPEAPAWPADLARTQDRLIADLAHHHITQAQVDAALAGHAAPAAAMADAAAWQTAQDHTRAGIDAAQVALNAARARLNAATATSSAAEATVADARLAYRAGKEAMGGLYVAEAGALAAREALADAGVAIDAALLRLWAAQGAGAADAPPPTPGAP